MNLFRNLKITHQFLIVFGVLILGFVAIGLAYKQVLDTEQASASLLQKTNAFGDLVNRASADVSAMNAEEATFLLTKDLAQAENFEALAGQVQQKVDDLEQTVPEKKAVARGSFRTSGIFRCPRICAASPEQAGPESRMPVTRSSWRMAITWKAPLSARIRSTGWAGPPR